VLTAAQSRLRINRALNLIILFIAKYIDVYCICRVVRGRLLDNGVKGVIKRKEPHTTPYDTKLSCSFYLYNLSNTSSYPTIGI